MTSIKEVCLDRYEDLNPAELVADRYFTEIEINEFQKSLEKTDYDYDISIKDWHMTTVAQYNIITIYTDINEVVKWRNLNKLRFNPDTQRDLIVIETHGVPIKKLDINEKSIKDMKKLMVGGLYFPVTGTININPDINEEPYIIRGGNLIIPSESHMDLIEGFHNYVAETQLKDENPDWEFPCEFKLMTLNKEDANRYIFQMDKKNHFREAQVARIDTQNETNYLINSLNTSSSFHLKGTINKDAFLFLYKQISKMFILEKRKQTVDLLYVFIKNLNHFIIERNHFDEPLTNSEWFINLYLTKYTQDNGIDFINLYNSININELLNSIVIKNSPLKKHLDEIKNAISEVNKNVL
jgi:hypothetical protein